MKRWTEFSTQANLSRSLMNSLMVPAVVGAVPWKFYELMFGSIRPDTQFIYTVSNSIVLLSVMTYLVVHAPKAARLLTTGLFDDGVVAGQFFLDALSALQSRIAGDDWSEAAIAQEVMAVHRSNTAREIRANVERRLSQFVRQSEKYLVSLTRRQYTDELDWIEPVVRYWVTP